MSQPFLLAMSSTVSWPSEIMPTDLAIALAVMGWSPVTMITLIPADLHLSTASGTAALGFFSDDTNRFGDSLGSNGMVTSNHDNFDTSRSTFVNSIRYSSSWGINHGHEADKSETFKGEVCLVSIERISS